MAFKGILEEIQTQQFKNLVSLKDFRQRGEGKGTDILACKSRGLYWLWCKTDLTKLINTEIDLGAHVPISKLIRNRNGLGYVCKINSGKYTVVYNGIGGYKNWTKKSSYGLRGRINQEINCNNKKTGTLNIAGRGLDINDWKVSFFDFEDPENQYILKMFLENSKKLNEENIGNLYNSYANELEILWRMHYGTPILCRH